MARSNQIIVYEETDKDCIDKHIALLGNYELKSYKKYPIADAMVLFLLSLEQNYDHAYVLIGEGRNSRDWLSKEICTGHNTNRYTKITPLFITNSHVPEWWKTNKSLKYLDEMKT